MSLINALIFDQLALNMGKLKNYTLVFLLGGMAYYTFSESTEQDSGLSIGNSNWNILSTSLSVLTGYFLWDEEISNNQFLGIMLGISGLYLINKK